MKKKAPPIAPQSLDSLSSPEPPTLTAAQRLNSLNSSEPATLTEAVFRLLPQIEESLRQGRLYAQILAELKTAGLEINPVSFRTLLSRARIMATKRLSDQASQSPADPTPTAPVVSTSTPKERDTPRPQNEIPTNNAHRIIRPKADPVITHNDTPSLKDFV